MRDEASVKQVRARNNRIGCCGVSNLCSFPIYLAICVWMKEPDCAWRCLIIEPCFPMISPTVVDGIMICSNLPNTPSLSQESPTS